jgi:hypothetical protein
VPSVRCARQRVTCATRGPHATTRHSSSGCCHSPGLERSRLCRCIGDVRHMSLKWSRRSALSSQVLRPRRFRLWETQGQVASRRHMIRCRATSREYRGANQYVVIPLALVTARAEPTCRESRRRRPLPPRCAAFPAVASPAPRTPAATKERTADENLTAGALSSSRPSFGRWTARGPFFGIQSSHRVPGPQKLPPRCTQPAPRRCPDFLETKQSDPERK